MVVDPEDYPKLLESLSQPASSDSARAFRRQLAWKAFQHVASYDSAVAEWLWQENNKGTHPDSQPYFFRPLLNGISLPFSMLCWLLFHQTARSQRLPSGPRRPPSPYRSPCNPRCGTERIPTSWQPSTWTNRWLRTGRGASGQLSSSTERSENSEPLKQSLQPHP